MSEAREAIDRILGPRTVSTAMRGIQYWDRNARSAPLLSEQMQLMQDGPQTWSTTHSWPSVRSALHRLGLIEELDPIRQNGWVIPVTEITDLGREVRAALTSPTK